LGCRCPKLPHRSYFQTWLLEPGRRAEKALTNIAVAPRNWGTRYHTKVGGKMLQRRSTAACGRLSQSNPLEMTLRRFAPLRRRAPRRARSRKYQFTWMN
jgi:hypothetical protein